MARPRNEHLMPKELYAAIRCCKGLDGTKGCSGCPNAAWDASTEEIAECRFDLMEEMLYQLERANQWARAAARKQRKKEEKQHG